MRLNALRWSERDVWPGLLSACDVLFILKSSSLGYSSHCLLSAIWILRIESHATVLIQTLSSPLNQTALPNKETKITVCFVCKLTWWILGWRYSHAPLNEFSFQVLLRRGKLMKLSCEPTAQTRMSFPLLFLSLVAADIWVNFQSLEVQHTNWLLSNFMLSDYKTQPGHTANEFEHESQKKVMKAKNTTI